MLLVEVSLLVTPVPHSIASRAKVFPAWPLDMALRYLSFKTYLLYRTIDNISISLRKKVLLGKHLKYVHIPQQKSFLRQETKNVLCANGVFHVSHFAAVVCVKYSISLKRQYEIFKR